MLEAADAKSFDDELDILGQQALNLYTQICLCFSVADPSLHSNIIHTLRTGLERLSASFPWVAGKVVNDGAGEGDTGIFKIAPFEEYPTLVVKDHRDDPSFPTMDDFQRANFPIAMLDENAIAPRNTIPGTSGEPLHSTSPVLLVQANFVAGGLLLTINGQHQAMDMAGQAAVIRLLSKACAGTPFTPDALSVGNLPRRAVIPLLDATYQQGDELARQTFAPPPSASTSSSAVALPPPPTSTWAYFSFSPASLTALKSLAAATAGPGATFVSADDAISALLWQRVTRARLSRLDPAGDVSLARAVDVRRFLGVPADYPGLLLNMTYHTRGARGLVDAPLGEVAAGLRAALDPRTSDLAFRTRALVTALERARDKSVFGAVASLNLESDLMLSSWAKCDLWPLDFGLGLGKPVAVRRPRLTPVESLMYLMPRRPDGEISAAVCLREEDMDKLRADEEFAKYAEYVG